MKKSLMLTDFALACAFGVLAVFSAFLPFCADAPRWWRVVARMVTLAITALLYTRQYGERRLFPLRFLCVAVCLFWTGIFILTFMRPGSVLDGIWYMQYIQKSVVHLWGLAASLYLLVISLRLRREGGRALIPTVAAAAAGACMKMASGKRRKTEIPLAPFFLTGFLLEWMLGKASASGLERLF